MWMNDLLWLLNHPLWGNFVGIPTSQNLDTPEGLESQSSVRIHRILTELRHSTELELGKLYWIWMDCSRAFMFELLWGLPTSREVLQPSLLRSTIGGSTSLSSHFLLGEHWGIYRRSKTVLWLKIGRVRPTCQAGRPWNLGERKHMGSIWSKVTCLALPLAAAQILESRAPIVSQSHQCLMIATGKKQYKQININSIPNST
jgi:hypothetical protein